MNENKKGFKVRHKRKVAHIEPSKPRNFVAKNAINTGAGAHKDKKKAMKQGDTKHKKDYAEHLESMLSMALNEAKFNPLDIPNPDDVHKPIKGDEPVKRGDIVWAQDPHNIATVHAGKVKRIGRTFVFLTLKNGEELAVPHDEVSKNYDVLSKRAHTILNKKGKHVGNYKVDEKLDMCPVCGQTPCNCTHIAEGAKVDRQAKHITQSMMKKGKSKDEAEAIAWAHIKHPKKKKKAKEGWTHDTLAARLFEQELTYEDELNNMLAKKLQK